LALDDHPAVRWQQYEQITDWIRTTHQRSGWTVRRILGQLGLAASTYYRIGARRRVPSCRGIGPKRGNIYELLPEERMLILDYALAYPERRHRGLAWQMLDEDVVSVSPASAYRVLRDKGLVARWPERWRYEVGQGRHRRADIPDERWLTDPTYIRIEARWWYLIYFIDEYSRYIVHWELLYNLEASTIELAAERALGQSGRQRNPIIQTDNGPAFISADFKGYLAQAGITQQRIRPHCPTDNAIVERVIRTGKELAGDRFESGPEAYDLIGRMVIYYNQERPHSALNYLRPIDYYRGNPEQLLAVRRDKIAAARDHRRRVNMGCRRAGQSRFPAAETEREASLAQEPTLSHSL